jgi:zinc protease
MNQLMRSFVTVILFLLFCCGTGLGEQRVVDKLKYPPLRTQEPPNIEKITLDNGLTLYLLEDHELPIINAAVRLGAGEYLVREDKVGLASITGAVMRTGGTEKMTGDQIDSALEAVGASIEVSISRTSGSARMNILSEYVDMGLSILADILRRPVFSQDKIDLQKTSERSAIARRNDEPTGICGREFRKIIYGSKSPYAMHTEYSTIDNISREDLIAFHKQCITPENVMIAVWGDFNKDEMAAKLRKYFEDWPAGSGKMPKFPEVKYEFKPGIHYIAKDNVNQSTIFMGHIGGLTGDPDYFAMVVMNNILGGAFSSRLFNNVRSKLGLAYTVAGNYTSNIAYPGVYYNYCLTKSESTVKAIRSMIAEIKRMQTDPPTPEEMRLGKDGYLNSFVFNFEDKGDVITRMMEYDYFGFPNDFLYKVKDNIEKVTPADVIAVAQKRLHPDALQIVVVGKGSDFDEPLSALGAVDTIDVTIPSGAAKEEIAVTQETLAKGKDLFNLAMKACGGKENFKKIKAISSKGSISLATPQGEFALQMTSLFSFPDKTREAIITPMGEMLSVSNGKEGWTKQGANVIASTEEQMKEAKKESFRNTILAFKNIEDTTYQVVFVKADKLGDKSVNIIQIGTTDGQTTYKLALDAGTNIPVAKFYFGQTMMGPGNLTEIYSDYRDISGIKIPFAMRIESDGQKVAETAITDYQINPIIPAGSFDKPK